MDECYCQCHNNDTVMHITACCDGPCPGCRQLISLGRMEEHKKRCCVYLIFKEEDERVWRTINQPYETVLPVVEPENR
jgi:hypothetical protein